MYLLLAFTEYFNICSDLMQGKKVAEGFFFNPVVPPYNAAHPFFKELASMKIIY